MSVTPTYLTENLAELWLICPGFDDLLLTDDTTDADGNLFKIKALADSPTWGKPVPIDVAVQRWMTDGAVASTQGFENREISFKVKIEAETAAELAVGEAALALRSAQPVLLKWVPPTGPVATVPTVFEVWTWNFEHGLDLSDELHVARGYTVTMTAKPWARSADLTTIPALATVTSPTVTSIDTCTSATGWTNLGIPGTPTVSGGGLYVRRAETVGGGAGPFHTGRGLLRTGTVTGLGALDYLILDMHVTGGFPTAGYAVQLDGGTLLVEAAVVGTQHYYTLPAGVTGFSTLSIYVDITYIHSVNITFYLDDVSASDSIAPVGSHKQLMRSIDGGGSITTAGSIQIASPDGTTPLGTVLAYTCPDRGTGYTPPLRPYRTAGNTLTADAAAVSGQREIIVSGGASSGAISYAVPISQLREASYVILGRLYSTATTTITITLNAFVTGLSGPQIVKPLSFITTNAYQWFTLGALSLPDRMVPAESTLTYGLNIAGTGGTGSQYVDELYLLDTTNGAYSLLSAVALPRLWLDAPDADPLRNRPAIYAGTASDRSDAYRPDSALILSGPGDHEFDPGGTVLLTVTDGVNDAVASASVFFRWHTHAGI